MINIDILKNFHFCFKPFYDNSFLVHGAQKKLVGHDPTQFLFQIYFLVFNFNLTRSIDIPKLRIRRSQEKLKKDYAKILIYFHLQPYAKWFLMVGKY